MISACAHEHNMLRGTSLTCAALQSLDPKRFLQAIDKVAGCLPLECGGIMV